MRSVLNEVQYPVKDRVRERVAGLNEPPVWYEVDDRVWSPVGVQVGGRVRDPVWDQVWNEAEGKTSGRSVKDDY